MNQSIVTSFDRQAAKAFCGSVRRHGRKEEKRQKYSQRIYRQYSEQAIARAKKNKGVVALQPWGLKQDIGEVSDAKIEQVVSSLERQGYEIQLLPGNLRRVGQGEWIEANMLAEISKLRGQGIKKLVLFVARSGEHMQEFMGALSIAGIEIILVGIKGYNLKPTPCTRKHAQDKEAAKGRPSSKWNSGIPGALVVLKGEWIELRKGIYKWQEPRWSFNELALTEFAFGSVIMWSEKDYMNILPSGQRVWAIETAFSCEWKPALASSWTPGERGMPLREAGWEPRIRYMPLVPPEEATYPHKLELKGFCFSEVPARYIDYLVGQDWIYGEFGERLRQWHAHPVIQAELARYEDKELESNHTSDSTGYWTAKDKYVYTGCQGGKSIKQYPVWLTPRDRFGKPLRKPRVKFGQQLQDRYAAGLEKQGFEDLNDPMPENWKQGVPWAFEGLADSSYEREKGCEARDNRGRSLGNLREDSIEESDSLEGEEGTHYLILDEAEDFLRKPTDEAKWIYNANIHLGRMIERAVEKAIVRGQQARASGDEERIFDAEQHHKEAKQGTDKQREWAEKKAEAHAWYLGAELLSQLERIQQRISSENIGGKVKDDATGKEETVVWRLHRELDNIGVQITPELKKYLAKPRPIKRQVKQEDGSYQEVEVGTRSMIDTLRCEWRATKQLLRKKGEELRGDPATEQIADVLREHPEQIYNLMKFDYGLLIQVLREHRDLDMPTDLISKARKFHKEQVRRFPELYTKKGKRRVYPAHERKSRVSK